MGMWCLMAISWALFMNVYNAFGLNCDNTLGAVSFTVWKWKENGQHLIRMFLFFCFCFCSVFFYTFQNIKVSRQCIQICLPHDLKSIFDIWNIKKWKANSIWSLFLEWVIFSLFLSSTKLLFISFYCGYRWGHVRLNLVDMPKKGSEMKRLNQEYL